jgi:tetratricopeptide (TPR) repeat protein
MRRIYANLFHLKKPLRAFLKILFVRCGYMKIVTRNKWLLLLLILLLSGNTFAQRSLKDKILIQLSQATNDTSRIKPLIQLAFNYDVPDSVGIKYLKEAIDFSKKNNYRYGLAFENYYESQLLLDDGRYVEAFDKCQRCIDALDSLRIIQPLGYPLYKIGYLFDLSGRQTDKFRYYTEKAAFYQDHGPIENTAQCFHNIAGYYFFLPDYDKAIEYYIRARDAFKSFDPFSAENDLECVGVSYLEWGNLDKAEEYMKSALNELVLLDEVYISFYCYCKLGEIYFKRHDYKQALNYFREARLYYFDNLDQATNLTNIAAVYLQLNTPDSAFYYLTAADKIRTQEKYMIFSGRGKLEIEFNFYKYYLATGDPKKALQCLEKALQEAQAIRNLPFILKYTNELHSFLLKEGDSLSALRYLIQYQSFQDSLNKMNTQARIATFEIEQQAQLKENEIEQLQTQKATQRNYYLIGGALILMIVFAVISRLRYKRKRDEQQLQADFKKQLAQAETKALRAQMNPHFIFNSLNSINSFVIEQKHEIASDYLIKFSKLIRLILDNSRSETISLDKELETLKLYVILESARFDNKFKCVYKISEEVNTNSIMIPPMLLQPFVENAIWHGLMQKEGEGTITVEIKKQDEEFLNISIIDDGIGREKAAQLKSKSATHTSHGLKVTSQRIDMMNKLNSTGAQVRIFDLKDDQGHAMGTKVELIIPF